VDARTFPLEELGEFDLVSLYCVLYHLADAAEDVIARVATVSDTVVLQGNLPRLTTTKYAERGYQDLAGVDGMTAILRRHGFGTIEVVAPEGHPKPLVIGTKASSR
jgi:hypothetical protein